MQTGASLVGGVRFVLRTRKIYMAFSKEEEVYMARFRALFATIVLSVPHRVAHVITIVAVFSCAVELVSFFGHQCDFLYAFCHVPKFCVSVVILSF